MRQKSVRTKTFEEQPCYVYTMLVFLAFCYGGKMYCSTDVNISQPLLKESAGLTDGQISFMFASGYIFSFFGKMAAGPMADSLGGRFVLVLSTIGSIVPSVLLAMVPAGVGTFPAMLALWGIIGFFALGSFRIGVTALAANWIPVKYLGRLMSLVGLSPMLGDVIVRLSLAPLLGKGWCLVVSLPACLFVSNAPGASEDTIQAAKEEEDRSKAGKPPESYLTKVAPLLKKLNLWILCLLSGTLFGTRTLFLYYVTNYLAAVRCHELGEGDECLVAPETLEAASTASAVFAMVGCISTVLVGTMKDALPKQHRAACIAPFLLVLFASMLYLMGVGIDLPFDRAVAIIGVVGFTLFGPWKILGNAFSVDVGGKALKATACSLMGSADSIATVALMVVKGSLGSNWVLMFGLLTILSFVALVCGITIWIRDLLPPPSEAMATQEPLIREMPEQPKLKRRNSYLEEREAQH